MEGFKHFCLVMSINGTHLNIKDTLMICMGCDENNQLFPLDSLILYGENIDGWGCLLACIRNGVT